MMCKADVRGEGGEGESETLRWLTQTPSRFPRRFSTRSRLFIGAVVERMKCTEVMYTRELY